MDYYQKFLEVVLFMPGFLFSLSLHEASHGFVASLFGDNTAKRLGRVTLNPIPHIDPVGTLLLPIIGVITGFFFGWGNPVPVDYRNLKRPRQNGLWIALAGPTSNFIFAVVLSFLIKFLTVHGFSFFGQFLKDYQYNIFLETLVMYLYLNLGLCFFNLLPIGPLDGSNILAGILSPKSFYHFQNFMSRYGTMLLLFLFLTGMIRMILTPPIMFMGRFLLG